MGQDTFKKLLFGWIFFSLFVFMALLFVAEMGTLHGVSTSDIGGEALNIGLFNDTNQEFESDAQDQLEAWEGGELADVDSPTGLKSITKSMKIGFITEPFNLLSNVLVNIFEVPSIVINVLLTVLSLSIILGIWSLLKKGD